MTDVLNIGSLPQLHRCAYRTLLFSFALPSRLGQRAPVLLPRRGALVNSPMWVRQTHRGGTIHTFSEGCAVILQITFKSLLHRDEGWPIVSPRPRKAIATTYRAP